MNMVIHMLLLKTDTYTGQNGALIIPPCLHVNLQDAPRQYEINYVSQ